MNSLAIIPSRYASTRLPGKPLILIDGKTMIRRVWEQVSIAVSNVVVATDDKRIKKEVESFGGRVVLTRTDHTSGTDRCKEALELFQKEHPVPLDVVMNIQGDEPFLNPEQIHQLLSVFSNREIQIATLVKRITNPEDISDTTEAKVVMNEDHFALYFSRAPIPYCRNCNTGEWLKQGPYYKHVGMYGFRPEMLKKLSAMKSSPLETTESLEQLRWLQAGLKVKVAETSYETFSVDEPGDLEKMKREGLLNNFSLPVS